MRINSISHSRRSTWNTCRYMYRLRYHDKIKSPLPEPDYFEFGKFVHLAFELHVRDGKKLEECFGEAHKKYNEFGNDYLKEIPTIARNFKSLNDNLRKNIVEELAEKQYDSVPLHEPPRLLLESNQSICYNAIIDRIVQYPQNVLIVDYKTTSPKNEKKSVNNDEQLMLYTFIVHKMSNIPVGRIHTMLFYPRTGHKVMTSFEQKKIYSFAKMCSQEVSDIANCKPEDANPTISWQCNYCEYRTICKTFTNSRSKK